MNGNLLQITPHPTHKELGFVVIFVSCHSFFLSVEAFLRKVSVKDTRYAREHLLLA
jgi:hypothetical protein